MRLLDHTAVLLYHVSAVRAPKQFV